MIKAFLFDYDGVITQGVDVKVPSERLAENLGISIEEATNSLVSIWDGYSVGELSMEEMWKGIENHLGKKISSDKRDIWFGWDELTPIPFMLKFVGDLKSKGYPVGLVSNVFLETADIIRQNGGYDSFDFTVLSCEVGARKPDQKIYEYAMEKLNGINTSEVVFLDDRQHSIDGAREFGLNTIHVINHENAMKEVYSLIKHT